MIFNLFMSRLMQRANQATYQVFYSPKGLHFFSGPIEVKANSLYEANRKFDVTYPDYVRRETKEV